MYLGRYNTVCLAVFIALVGHVIIIVSALPGVIEKESALGAYIIGLIITGLGTGLFKSNISPLVAEQYRRTKLFISTTSRGERVIVDPVMTISRVYMVRLLLISTANEDLRQLQYFYLFTNIGALVGQISMSYSEKYVGFWLAYTLPTVVFLLCPIVLWIGRNRYIRSPPTGSVMATAFRLWRFAMKGRWSFNPLQTYRNLTAPDFWENAKPSKHQGESLPSWMTFDDRWVDEVRRGLKACAVFCWFPLYCQLEPDFRTYMSCA